MFCKSCGKSVDTSMRQCPHCGRAVDALSGGTGFWDLLTDDAAMGQDAVGRDSQDTVSFHDAGVGHMAAVDPGGPAQAHEATEHGSWQSFVIEEAAGTREASSGGRQTKRAWLFALLAFAAGAAVALLLSHVVWGGGLGDHEPDGALSHMSHDIQLFCEVASAARDCYQDNSESTSSVSNDRLGADSQTAKPASSNQSSSGESSSLGEGRQRESSGGGSGSGGSTQSGSNSESGQIGGAGAVNVTVEGGAGDKNDWDDGDSGDNMQ